MRLTDNEYRVLNAIHLNADLSVIEIAKVSGVRPHAVRYLMRKFVANEVVTKRTYINVFRLGFSFVQFCFSTTGIGKTVRSKFLKYLINHPRVSYLAHTGGEREYVLDLVGRNVSEINDRFKEICSEFPEVIRDIVVIQIHRIVDLPFRFLDRDVARDRSLEISGYPADLKIDDLDDRILETLSSIEEGSLPATARKLGASYTTVLYRLGILKKAEIVVGTRYLVDLNKLGYRLFYNYVVLRKRDKLTRQKVEGFICKHFDVFAFLETSGSWDYIVETAVSDSEAGGNFAQEIMDEFPAAIEVVSPMPLFSWLKVSQYPSRLGRL